MEIDYPYRKTGETLRIEKRIKNYIAINKLPLTKNIGDKLFSVLLKETPIDKQAHYRKHGMPFPFEGIQYTLKVK